MDTVVVVVLVVMVVLVVSVAIVLVMVLVMLMVEVMMAMVMVVLVVGKKALPSKLCLHPLHFCKVPIKRALPGKVFKSQFPSARMRCSDLDLEQLGCLEGSLRLSDVVCVHMQAWVMWGSVGFTLNLAGPLYPYQNLRFSVG